MTRPDSFSQPDRKQIRSVRAEYRLDETADEQVEDAVVVPIEDEEFGQRPVAFVKCSERISFKDIDFTPHLQHLPRFMIPVAFYEWPTDIDQGSIKPTRKYFRDLAAKHSQAVD